MTKIGRPTDSIKEKTIKARIDKETEEMLDYCLKHTDMTKSEIIRAGIKNIYETIKGDSLK